MEFWGTEVTPGEPVVCHPGDEMYCHVSQAALGPSQLGKSERVVLRVETGGKVVVLGTLSSGKCDQMALDLIFDREFKLYHTGVYCSVYFCGYKTEKGEPEEYDSEMEEEDEEESEEEEAPDAVPMKANGDAKLVSAGKVSAELAKKASKIVKAQLVDDEADEGEDPDEDDDDEDEFTQMNSTVMDFGTDDSDEEDDSEFEEDDEDEEDDSDVDDSDELDEDEDDSDDEDESEDEEMATPEIGKKRPLKENEVKTPASGKKARVDTPAKPGSLTAAEYWESLIVAGGKALAASPGKKSEKAAAKAATPAKTALATPTKKSKEGKDAKESKDAKKEHKTPQKSPGKDVSVKTPKTGTKTPAAKLEATPTPGSGKKGLGSHRCEPCNRNFATEAAVSQHMTAKHATPSGGK